MENQKIMFINPHYNINYAFLLLINNNNLLITDNAQWLIIVEEYRSAKFMISI